MSLFFSMLRCPTFFLFFFFNDTATTEIYTLSLHGALPISKYALERSVKIKPEYVMGHYNLALAYFAEFVMTDRKSTRLNSSHQIISYAVFSLKKNKHTPYMTHQHTVVLPIDTMLFTSTLTT